MKRISAISTSCLILALPAAASAHRPATRAEKTALVYQASGRYYGGISVNEPRSVPRRCFTADIATVVHSSRWGAWTFSRYADQPQNAQRCRAGNGIVIEHKLGTRWYAFWEGSDGYPPTHDKHSGSFSLKGVPRAVAKDLVAGLA